MEEDLLILETSDDEGRPAAPITFGTIRARLNAGTNTVTVTSISSGWVSIRELLADGVTANPIEVPFGDVIEAESGELTGGSILEEEDFSGGVGVSLAQPGQRVAFTLNAEQAGRHRFLINAKVTASSTFVQVNVLVNGEKQNDRAIEFFWSCGRAREEALTIDLQAGENIAEVEFEGIRGRKIDDLEIDFVSFGFDTGVPRLPIVQ